MSHGINRLYKVGEEAYCLCGCKLGGKVTKVDKANLRYYFIQMPDNYEESADMHYFHESEPMNLKVDVWNKPYLGEQ